MKQISRLDSPNQYIPKRRFIVFHSSIGKEPCTFDYKDELFDNILSTVHIQQTTNDYGQTGWVHLQSKAIHGMQVFFSPTVELLQKYPL